MLPLKPINPAPRNSQGCGSLVGSCWRPQRPDAQLKPEQGMLMNHTPTFVFPLRRYRYGCRYFLVARIIVSLIVICMIVCAFVAAGCGPGSHRNRTHHPNLRRGECRGYGFQCNDQCDRQCFCTGGERKAVLQRQRHHPQLAGENVFGCQ